MSIRIKLIEDEVLVIDADAEEWSRAYSKALDVGGMVEIHSDQGRKLAINPQQILYWEEVPGDLNGGAESRDEASRDAQPA